MTCQDTPSRECPRPHGSHLGSNCPTKVLCMESPGTSGPAPTPASAVQPGCPLYGESQELLSLSHFSFSSLLGHPLHREPEDSLACSYFSFSCPARVLSMQRALRPPWPTPTSPPPIPPGQSQHIIPQGPQSTSPTAPTPQSKQPDTHSLHRR